MRQVVDMEASLPLCLCYLSCSVHLPPFELICCVVVSDDDRRGLVPRVLEYLFAHVARLVPKLCSPGLGESEFGPNAYVTVQGGAS